MDAEDKETKIFMHAYKLVWLGRSYCLFPDDKINSQWKVFYE